jgi:hypothetical protein
MKSNICVFFVSSKQGFGSRICFKIFFFICFQNSNDDDDDEDMVDDPADSFDSFKIVKRKGKKHFCKCKRGPIGHPGAPGIEGQFTEKSMFWSFPKRQ